MRVLFVLEPAVNLLDLSGPAQVFSAAKRFGAEYDLAFCSAHPVVQSAQGVTFSSLDPLDESEVFGEDTIVFVPGRDLTSAVEGELASPQAQRWVRRAYEAGARIASVCTGAAVLGEAGLLDGRRCTTHWSVVEHLRARYPQARVKDDVLFVHDGRISTSAGIASGIDLALSILEADHGPAVAAAVARELVIYVRRNGNASTVSPFLAHREHLHSAVHRAQDVIAGEIDTPHTLKSLAAAVHLSPRGLHSAFVAATGLTPARYQTELRLDLAETLLRTTSQPIEQISHACGYRDARQFRRMFAAHRGIAPSTFRQSLSL